jgi:3'-phosphoadenosine 5'-phosphosulfate sulfotransferase (PAPS reductase)/FAD synthetase
MSAPLRVVSVSGGKDSSALYCWAIDQWGKGGFHAVFSDTGNEHPVTLNYLRNLAAMAGGPRIDWVHADIRERLRKKMTEAEPSESEYVNRAKEMNADRLRENDWTSGNAFLDLMLWKGRAPSTKAQFCTEFLKIRPIKDYVEKLRGDREVEIYVGIRAGESERRSKMDEREFSELYDGWMIRPLLRWSEEEVFAFLKSKGVPPNPLYENGFSRVGCFPCIHARKSELASLPEWAWDKLEDWEKRIGRSWFPPGLVPGIGIPSIKDAREWARTSRGGKQIDMFAADAKDVPSCMSTWGVCE